MTVRHWVALKTVGTLAAKAPDVVSAQGVPSAWRSCTFIEVDASLSRACVPVEPGGAVAAITALVVRTYGTWSANSRLSALVDIRAPIVRVTVEAVLTQARIVTGIVDTLGVHSTRLWVDTLVDVCTPFLSVALESWLAFAHKMRW